MHRVLIAVEDQPMKYTAVSWRNLVDSLAAITGIYHDNAKTTEPVRVYREEPRAVLIQAALLNVDVPKLRKSIQSILASDDAPDVSVSVRSQDIDKVHIVTADRNEPWFKFIGAE